MPITRDAHFHITSIRQRFDTIYKATDKMTGREYALIDYETDGQLDDVRVYNRLLSVSEAQQLYSMGSSKQNISSPINSSKVNCSGINCGLAGYWTFDGRDILNGRGSSRHPTGRHVE